MAERYRIAEWDERYEVDDKGLPWKHGRPYRKGPLEFVRLTTFGLEPSDGWQGLIEVAGKTKALQVFGLFCKLLEIAGNKPRERRNHLPGPEAIAFRLHLPVRQVQEAYELLMRPEVGWVEKIPESPGISGNFREDSGTSRKSPTNQPNQPTNSTNRTNRAGARANGDGSGAAVAASGGADANSWATTRQLVRKAFGKDEGLSAAMNTIGTSLLSDRARADEVSRTIRALIGEATADGVENPKGYFVSCLKRRFRCLK